MVSLPGALGPRLSLTALPSGMRGVCVAGHPWGTGLGTQAGAGGLPADFLPRLAGLASAVQEQPPCLLNAPSCLGETRFTPSVEVIAPHGDQVTQGPRASSMPAIPKQTRLQGPGAALEEGRPDWWGGRAHTPTPKPLDARAALLPRERILAMDWAKDGFSATMSTVFIVPWATGTPPHSALRKGLRHRTEVASRCCHAANC